MNGLNAYLIIQRCGCIIAYLSIYFFINNSICCPAVSTILSDCSLGNVVGYVKNDGWLLHAVLLQTAKQQEIWGLKYKRCYAQKVVLWCIKIGKMCGPSRKVLSRRENVRTVRTFLSGSVTWRINWSAEIYQTLPNKVYSTSSTLMTLTIQNTYK